MSLSFEDPSRRRLTFCLPCWCYFCAEKTKERETRRHILGRYGSLRITTWPSILFRGPAPPSRSLGARLEWRDERPLRNLFVSRWPLLQWSLLSWGTLSPLDLSDKWHSIYAKGDESAQIICVPRVASSHVLNPLTMMLTKRAAGLGRFAASIDLVAISSSLNRRKLHPEW